MEFHDQSSSSGGIRFAALTIARSIQCDEINKKFKRIVLFTHDPINVPTAVGCVHAIWNNTCVDSIITPGKLPRLSVDSICPIGSTLLEISYISRMSGGMGSVYGYDGYFISIIVAPCLSFILDARGEKAR